MNTKEIQLQLIEYLDKYEKAVGDDKEMSVEDFASFVLRSSCPKDDKLSPTHIDVELAKNIAYLNRFIKVYLKKVMKGSPMQTEDEYTYLITLLQYKSLNKTELNNLNIFEKTTGTEIIKRLVKNGLATEFDDPDDGRSKRVMITEEGKKALNSILPDLGKVCGLITYPFNLKEKEEFYMYMHRLNVLHNEVFLNHRTESIDELLKLFSEMDK